MNAESVVLGSVGFWCWIRGFQVLLAWAIVYLPFSRTTNSSTFLDLFLILMFSYSSIRAHPLVYGRADSQGLRIRRYFQRRLVPWSEVKSIEWSSRGIRIQLTRPIARSASLEAFSNPAVSMLFHDLVGKPAVDPELVHWLKEHPVPGVEVDRRGAGKSQRNRLWPIVLQVLTGLILFILVIVKRRWLSDLLGRLHFR